LPSITSGDGQRASPENEAPFLGDRLTTRFV
jgi:hypothetical protein